MVYVVSNFFLCKVDGDIDIFFVDGINDDDYFVVIVDWLFDVLDSIVLDLVFYNVGVDFYCDDWFGCFVFSDVGLNMCDCFVFDVCLCCRIFIVIVIGGGYDVFVFLV